MAKVTYMPGKRLSGKASYYSNSSKPYPYLSRPTKWVVGTRCFLRASKKILDYLMLPTRVNYLS